MISTIQRCIQGHHQIGETQRALGRNSRESHRLDRKYSGGFDVLSTAASACIHASKLPITAIGQAGLSYTGTRHRITPVRDGVEHSVTMFSVRDRSRCHIAVRFATMASSFRFARQQSNAARPSSDSASPSSARQWADVSCGKLPRSRLSPGISDLFRMSSLMKMSMQAYCAGQPRRDM